MILLAWLLIMSPTPTANNPAPRDVELGYVHFRSLKLCDDWGRANVGKPWDPPKMAKHFAMMPQMPKDPTATYTCVERDQ
jgi:hypothetical protein